jgi:hypothetical protein
MRYILIVLVVSAGALSGCKSRSTGSEEFYDRYPQYGDRPSYFDKTTDYDKTNLNDRYSGSDE